MEYYLGKETTYNYEIIFKIPNEKFKSVEYFETYEQAITRYKWLETDCRNLLLALNEIKSVTRVSNWNE